MNYISIKLFFKKSLEEDFPGASVVKMLCVHCRGCGFNPWLGELRSHKLHSMVKKKNKKKTKNMTLKLEENYKQTQLTKKC